MAGDQKIKMDDDKKYLNRRQPINQNNKNKKDKVNQYNLITNNPIWLWHRSG